MSSFNIPLSSFSYYYVTQVEKSKFLLFQVPVKIGWSYPLQLFPGFGKKRKIFDAVEAMIEKQKSTSFSDIDFSSSSTSCIGCSCRVDSTKSSRCSGQKCSQKSISRETAKDAGSNHFSTEACSLQDCQEGSNHEFNLTKKRRRKYSWQRHRKLRKLSCQETNSLIPCSQILSHRDNFSGELQWGFNTNFGLYTEKVIS